MKNYDILLLTGHRKSGTTMFSNLFDGHKDLVVYPSDLCLLYAYFPYFSNSKLSNKKKLNRILEVIYYDFLKNVINKFELTKTQFDLNKYIKILKNRIDLNKVSKIDYILKVLFKSYLEIIKPKDFKYFVIKETSVDIYAQEFFKWFPNTKIIHLVRDPRDNYASLKSGSKDKYAKIGENEKKLLASLINRAKLDLDFGIINKKLYKNKYKILKYEDLTLNCKKEMKKICNFLKIKYEDILLKPTVFNIPNSGNNFEGENFINVSSKNVDRWNERISNDEAKIIEFYFSDLMKKYGYKLKFEKNSNFQPITEFYKWTNYEYFFHNSFKKKLNIKF